MPGVRTSRDAQRAASRERVPLSSSNPVGRNLPAVTRVEPTSRPNSASRLDGTRLSTEGRLQGDARSRDTRVAALALLKSIGPSTAPASSNPRPATTVVHTHTQTKTSQDEAQTKTSHDEAHTATGVPATAVVRTHTQTKTSQDEAQPAQCEDWKQVWTILYDGTARHSEKAAIALRNVIRTGKVPAGEAPRLLRMVTKAWGGMLPSTPYR